VNGIQSTGNTGGLQSGDAGDAERPAVSYRRIDALSDTIRAAELLRKAVECTQDLDLARALEKISAWISRE